MGQHDRQAPRVISTVECGYYPFKTCRLIVFTFEIRLSQNPIALETNVDLYDVTADRQR